MDFTVEYSEDIVIVRVIIRRATFLESLQFQNLLTREIENDYRKMVVDLSNCSSIDPAFFSAIITGYKRITNLGGNLKLVKPKNYLDGYEKLENNIRVFETFDSKEEAVESFRMIFTKPSGDSLSDNMSIAENS